MQLILWTQCQRLILRRIFTYTSKYFSVELTFMQGTAVSSTVLCHHSFGSVVDKVQTLNNWSKKRNSMQLHRLTKSQFTRLSKVHVFLPALWYSHAREKGGGGNGVQLTGTILGADSVGGKCDWEKAWLRPQSLVNCVGVTNSPRALIDPVYKPLVLLVKPWYFNWGRRASGFGPSS